MFQWCELKQRSTVDVAVLGVEKQKSLGGIR